MFNRDEHRSPSQRANKAMLNIVARLGGCGFLIYFVVKILTIPKEEAPSPTVTLIISIAFLVISAVLVFITVQDLFIGLKTGRFKASTYEEADLAEYLENRETAEAACACEDEQQADEAPVEDESEDDDEDKDNK